MLLRNVGNRGNWLILDLVGASANRDGIGAQIRLLAGPGTEQHGVVSTAGSYLSSGDRRVHFGLGALDQAELIEIQWPSGTLQEIRGAAANQILEVREPRGQ